MKLLTVIATAMGITMAIYYFAPRETTLHHRCPVTSELCVLEDKASDLVVHFSLGPKPLSSHKMVHYQVQAQGLTPEQVSIHLVGKSMHMEQDFFHLQKDQDHWSLARPFPLCTEKKMTWKMILLLKKERHYWRSYFDLEVEGKVL